MEKVLFVGNGINRIASNYAWVDVLEDLKKSLNNEDIVDNGKKPFPILYEEIYFRTKRLNDIEESVLLDNVVTKMNAMQPNELHDVIMHSNIKNIITTNYDYALEKVLGLPSFKTMNTVAGKAREKRYRITTKNTNGERSVWHIHGELKYRQSIVLGQAMYAKILSKMNTYLESPNFALKDRKSWIDFLFHDEVHILGFGLDYSEIDIWLALNERVRYYHKNPKKKINKIVFYLFDPSKSSQDLISILNSYNIEVVESKELESPKDFYVRILTTINEK